MMRRDDNAVGGIQAKDAAKKLSTAKSVTNKCVRLITLMISLIKSEGVECIAYALFCEGAFSITHARGDLEI